MIFTIGDLHLSLGVDKPMDIFSGWDNYVVKLRNNWIKTIGEDDVVVLAGDTSWGMSLEQALADFKFIESLPGKKIVIKGNHDYWWSSRKKMEQFFAANGLKSLTILHNSTVVSDDIAICGTRGWMLEEGTDADKKITSREEGRLKSSLEAAKDQGYEPWVFLHYPPVYADNISGGMIDIMKEYGVKQCFYGHLHGKSQMFSINGEYMGINFSLISSDYLNFMPKRVK